MPGITIIGLGPGNPDQITLEAWRALEDAQEVYLRTLRHPVVEALPRGPAYRSFDALYEAMDTFPEVYEAIAQRLLTLAERPEGVIYAVPGHPSMGETSVRRVLAMAAERALPVRIVAGLSFLEPATIALGIDPFDGLQIADATALAQRHHPNLDPDVAALVVQVYSRPLASEVKLTLMNLYHDDHPIRLVRAAGTPDESVRELPLYDLDRQSDVDHLTSIYIPALDKPGSVARFQDVVAHLRAPDGCPWDREQTHQTLRTHLLEETYEVLDALDADDMAKLREELGDLLLQILLHAQIAVEDGDFKLIDTVQDVIAKLVRRHPHVFAGETVQDSAEVLRHWEQIKRQERGERFASLLSGVSRALPSLSQALEMQRRAARVGFDWDSIEPVEAKVAEELDEFRQAPDPERRSAEFGDLLFSLVNLARWHAIDPESALREANGRFARRFESIERHAAGAGRPLEEMTLEEMDALWDEAKETEARDGTG
ncbi:MAG TPA: nucleoside triphosphate pyrophosphohydrolase [Chloroflexi bacterium]|jgi:tetrapyrrole methylase family protein/MazG family protein|nr:nucleoside triphosphate pyrophosphohydrolase [Chloroflexota bacterium]